MKTYVLTVSRTFPANHKRKGDKTYFEDKILKRYSDFDNFLGWQKIHTIRANYPFWEKRIKKVQEGKAVLSIRYWSGKPYNSKQVEICQLDENSGIGIENLHAPNWHLEKNRINELCIWGENIGMHIQTEVLAKNDGLSIDDFEEWFKKYNLSEPMAIIHFTKFRY